MKKLTLIGGAPLAGKTTLSRQIAKQDGAVELSTDSVRAWMRKLVREEEYPELFHSSGITAEEYYEKFNTAQKALEEEIAQGFQVEKGVIALLDTAITWEHLVIEGIALSPELMVKIKNNYTDREVETIVLVDKNKERIYQRISDRGLWGPRDTYPESLLPKEVEWVVLYNDWFYDQAMKCGIEPKLI